MEKRWECKSSTGKMIAVRKWFKPENKEIKGIIQLVHGMQEHIGRYTELAEFLVKEGYVVIGHDHLGHGDTVKEGDITGHFANEKGWDRLVEDVHLLQNRIKAEYPNLPYIIMGHSMGSLVVRTYITKYKDNIDGVILSGTSGQKYGLVLGICLIKFMKIIKGKEYKSNFIEYLVTGSFNRKFKPNKTKIDWTTRDKTVITNYMEDDKCGQNFTLQAYEDLLKGTYYLSRQKNINKTLNIPILIFSGEKDPVGGNGKGVKRVYHMLKKAGVENVTMKLFPEARHEMINETNKEEVYEMIIHWLKNIR